MLGRYPLRLFAAVLGSAAYLLSIALAPAAAQSGLPSLAEIATYNGPDRTARLIVGAKKEGEADVYTSETIDDVAALGAAFHKKYGVRLKLWRGSANDILQRAVLYLNFMLTDAQAILAKRDFLPASAKVPPSPAAALPPGTAVTFVDPAEALDQNQTWSTSYGQIVMNQPP
ncbi:MAG TPA: hypothetical protein VIJ04_14840 [Xanthobacteraceae bacterium]